MKTGKEFACKIVSKARIEENDLVSKFRDEVHAIRKLHHPGVVELVDFTADAEHFYAIQELCKSSLTQFITEKGKLSENEARSHFLDLITALDYIHSKNIVHRDLKPDNVLLGKDDRLKISDFGLSTEVSSNGRCKTRCGTRYFCAPEIIGGFAYFGKQADMWSLGVILYVMLTGTVPFSGKKGQSKVLLPPKSWTYEIPATLSEPCKDLIRGLVNVKNNLRFTLQQVFANVWVSGYTYVPRQLDKHRVVPLSLKRVDEVFEMESLGDWKRPESSLCRCPSVVWRLDSVVGMVSGRTKFL
jgi:serine/threonine protein kinase